MLMLSYLLVFLALIACPFAVETDIPEIRQFTLFKQCDAKWGQHALGTSRLTICQAGCAMSSLAMVLNTFNEKVDGQVVTPGTLNDWLTNHAGYVDGDLLVWAAGDRLGNVKFSAMHRGAGSLDVTKLKWCVDNGWPAIVNVRAGGHWVLVTGYNGTNFKVNDPGFSTTSYLYKEMSNFVTYSP